MSRFLEKTNFSMENPDLNTRLAALSPAKRALLEQKLRQNAAGKTAALGIPRRAERASAPLSFAQQRLWFLSQLEPNSCSYNESSAIGLRGPLHLAVLLSAINQLVARHEILRTIIATVDGEPRQFIKDQIDLDLPVIDLSGVLPGERGARTAEALLATMQRPFDLSCDAPLRFLLVRHGDQEHTLLKVMHHIASDGWSTAVVWRELQAYYRDCLSGAATRRPELPIQYQDYAEWQRSWLQGPVLEEQLAYWKKTLGGSEPLNLPADRPRTAARKSGAARASIDLDQELAEKLKALSKQRGVTLFMTLLAALQTLLHRYCGQNDIVVGSPIAGRTRPELEGLIGFFVNTLLLRLDLSNDPTFEQLLVQARDVALGAYAHQDLPFERLVEALNPVRDMDTLPLFNVMFAHQSVPPATIEFAGLETSPVEVPALEAKFDLFFAAVERGGRLRLRLDYAADLFERATIERLLANFQVLLKSIVDHPERRISELELITPAEKNRLLVQWNDTQQDYPNDKCIHQLFEAQARRAPNDVALLFGEQRLTYGDLNGAANQLARHLNQHGVSPGDVVALCMERSLDVVVGLLATLKAGGVYLPLEPQHPAARLRFMVEDAGARLLLTQQTIVEDKRWRMADGDPQSAIVNARCAVVCLDRDRQTIAQQSRADLDNRAKPDDLAYIIYTSGSTGVPKGVLGHHRGLVNRFHWMWERYPFEPGEVCCQKTSIGFVDSLWELLGPLLGGVPTVIVAESQTKDPAELIAALARHHVSRMVLVPSLLRAMLELRPALQEALPKLKFWVSSGEALSGELVRAFRRSLPTSRLVNLYGSSEVAADVTCWEVAGRDDESSPVQIGRPIANTQAYILDEHLNPVPIGAAGVLYIGGDGVAGGYLNQAELTAERFIAHSFDGEAPRRLYKTGDRARYLPDGNIEFLGRTDNQIKIRGYRVELGEIEAVLARHPRVRECAVVACDDAGPDLVNAKSQIAKPKFLLAYYAALPAATANELRDFLRQRLPEPMVPARFIALDALPMTSSGKLDRQALPRPDGALRLDQTNFVAPRTPSEEMLASIWAKLLGLARVGVEDNFFDSGGHSLLVVKLRAEIKQVLGKEVPLATLFRAPTIARLAQWLEREELGGRSSTLVPIQPSGTRAPFFCVHGAWGSVVFGTELARHLGPDQPFYGLQAPGMEGEQEPYTGIAEMAAHHVREIRRVQSEGPYFLAGLSMGGLIAFQMAQQLIAQGQKIGLLLLIDTYFPMRRRLVSRWSGRVRRLLVDDIFGRVVFHGRNLVLGGAGQGSTYAREKTRLLGKKVAAKLRLDHQGNQAHLSDIYAVRVRKANFAAMRGYAPQPYPEKITLLLTSAAMAGKAGSREAWGEVARGGLDVRIVPGDHSTMIDENNIGALTETLQNCLRDAQAGQR